MLRTRWSVFVTVSLSGCAAGTSPFSNPGGNDSGSIADGSPPPTSGQDGGPDDGSPSPKMDASSGLPTDSGAAPAQDSSPSTNPYDGPPGMFAYGPPAGTSGLPGLLTSVTLVTITWNADTENITSPIAAAFANVGSTAWWGALGQYCVPGASLCVGHGVTVTATHVGDPPGLPVVDSAVMQNSKDSFPRFVNDKSQPGKQGQPPDLPAPVTASTLFVFFLPQSTPATSSAPAFPLGTPVTVDGSPSCGYHSATVVNTVDVAYVVVPRCTVSGQSDVDVAIGTAFREIANAVTDPFRAEGRLGFHNPSSPSMFEIGDFCSGTTTVNGFSVPRIWSDPTMACAP